MTTSPNMNLPIPTIGTDTGLQWEQYVQAALNIIDGHTHASGSGVPVLPAGININADLPFNDNNATLLRSVRFDIQSAALSLPADLGCLYVTGADLYFNDENGNQIQITSGGAVNATSSGISSGNASAAFISTVLVVYSDTPTTVPGDISVGSVLLGLNTSSANRLTVSPPASLSGGSYSLVLPAIPASSLFVTLDTSGNFGTSSNIQGTQIAANSLTNAQLASHTITNAKLAILTPTVSGAGSASTASASYVTSGISRTITTTGGAVMVSFTGGFIEQTGATGTQETDYAVNNGAGIVWSVQWKQMFAGTYLDSPAKMNGIDNSVAGTPGTYTYTLYHAAPAGSATSIISNVKMTLVEL